MGDTAGHSTTPLVRKLGVDPGMRIRLIDAPEDYYGLLGATPAALGAEELPSAGRERADFTHLFATDWSSLEKAFIRARRGMEEDGMVWASWPKKSSGVPSEIGRAEVMAAGQKVGLVDVKVCAVDEIWSGLKFVIPLEERRG